MFSYPAALVCAPPSVASFDLPGRITGRPWAPFLCFITATSIGPSFPANIAYVSLPRSSPDASS